VAVHGSIDNLTAPVYKRPAAVGRLLKRHVSITRFVIEKTALFTVLLLPFLPNSASANPYLAKPGEAPATLYIASCAVTGGFTHLYVALDYDLFAKYGLNVKHVVIRGGTNISIAALSADEIQFLYCAGESTLPVMASGGDAVLIAAPLVGLPYVLIARKEIKTIQDLRGKIIGVGTVAGMPYRLLKMFEKKFNLQDIQIRPVGGSQPERYGAYQFSDLGLPALYSSLHTNSKSLRERRALVQKMVAAFAEAVRFVEDNPDKAKASVSRVLRLKDEDALQASYDAYAKKAD
jgi:ABC-type nitrate/sulfonate/bicarbonate transport system substrate-binding protein